MVLHVALRDAMIHFMTQTGTRCRRCHRPLKASAAAGIGPVCAKRERQEAATAAVKPDTLAKAREVLELGAIVNTRRTTRTGLPVFEVVSSSGSARYLASPAACVCKAGLKGRVCTHRVAAALYAA